MELMTSYERKGMEKGIKQGIEQGIEQGIGKGKIKGKQDSICKLLEAKFGSSAETLQKKVHSFDDLSLLDDVLQQVLFAESLEDAQRMIAKSVKV